MFSQKLVVTIPWSCAGYSSICSGRICHQNLAKSCESTEKVARKLWQVLDHQLQGPGGRPLQLRGVDGGDRGAAAALVADPVQRVLGCVTTVAT